MMWRGLPDRQKFAAFGLAALGVFVVGWVGSSYTHKPKEAVFKPEAVESTAKVKVHVVGAVAKPGVYELTQEGRIEDAINLAGGALADADVNQLNLAAHVTDGIQIVVPKKGETAPQPVAAPTAPDTDPVTTTSSAKPSGTGHGAFHPAKAKPPASGVSLNSANLQQLQALPGVGPATAKKIVDYRQAHGGFKSLEEVMAISGIGPKKFAKMKPYLRL